MKSDVHDVKAEPAAIKSVMKALSLLTHVRPTGSLLTELAHSAHIPVPTAYRMLTTLQQGRYLIRDEDGRFLPGPAMYEIVFRLDAEGFIRGQATAAIEQIRNEVGETASFVVSIGRGLRRAVLVAQSNHPVHRHLKVGLTLPTIAGASGHVLIAFGDTAAELDAVRWVDGEAVAPSGTVFTRASLLEECERVRRAGFAYSSGTADGQAWGIAAPVYANDMLIGAVAVSAPNSRRTQAQVKKGRESVLKNAASLSARLTLSAQAVATSPGHGHRRGRGRTKDLPA